MTGPVLSVRDAQLTLGARTLWSALELDVAPGEFVAVLGATPAAQEACVFARRVGFRASLAADVARAGQPGFDAAALDRAGTSFVLVATQG